MLGFALMGVIMCVLGGIAAQGLTVIRESLRVVYEDYTVAGTDLATVANNLNRTRTNDFMALDATNKEEFEEVMKRDVEITESVKKPLETYAATTLRISKTGRDEAKDLKKFRDAYECVCCRDRHLCRPPETSVERADEAGDGGVTCQGAYQYDSECRAENGSDNSRLERVAHDGQRGRQRQE